MSNLLPHLLQAEYRSKNVQWLFFREDKAAFLGGFVSGWLAMLSDNLNLGLIAGNRRDTRTARHINGFLNGVKSQCTECNVWCVVPGSQTDDEVEGSWAAQELLSHQPAVIFNAGI